MGVKKPVTPVLPTEMSIELEHTEQFWLALFLLDGKQLVQDASTGRHIPLELPKGCKGLMLVFEDGESAREHFKGPVDVQLITRTVR